jgi:hypothetical protein
MKMLCMLIFTIFLTTVVAQENNQEASTIPGQKDLDKKSARVVKSAKAYRRAKEECLKKNEDIKGKKLTDCIVEYQKEAK